MAISFHPRAGAILICNYDTGFKPPEMVKRRLCVVVSPRLRRREGLCSVVPLSTTPPREPLAYQPQLDLGAPLPKPWAAQEPWAKCDMVATVSFERLTPVGVGRKAGRRVYVYPHLTSEQLVVVQSGVLAALGLQKLTLHL